jgi:YgiT-type zinc finger domain-containing protein
MKRCPRCKSDALKKRTIQYSQEFEGNFFIIEHVPAYVCEQCGEIILSETTAEKIQDLIWSGAEPERTRLVPVYEIV